MGISLKTENEEWSGMTLQIRGSKAGGALHLSSPCEPSVVIPGSPSARLTRGLKLNTGQWLLRLSVLREIPMTSTVSIPFQKARMLQSLVKLGTNRAEGGSVRGKRWV
jgi:hypothetical protein